MTISLRAAGIRRVLLDIEGTTTPIAFVHEVLFPFARVRIREWFQSRPASDPEAREIVDALRRELEAEPAGGDAGRPTPDSGDWHLDTIVDRVHALMDQDRKSHALKILQGKIWQQGYRSGALKSDVYADVPTALARWTGAGLAVGIFSSGSVLAQKLLFAHTSDGDLTRFLSCYFDTSVGPKIESASYARIAKTLDTPPAEMLFVSDVVKELDAAREAGMQTVLCVRPPAQRPLDVHYPTVTSFDEVEVDGPEVR